MIVGLVGLVGVGRSEIAHAIFGADQRDAGEIVYPTGARWGLDAVASGSPPAWR